MLTRQFALHRLASRRSRPQFELLEGRQLLASFSITNTNDNGPGSLRQAILDSNHAIGSTVNTIASASPVEVAASRRSP